MSQIQNRFKIGYLHNNGYQQQPAANIGQSILFSCVQFCKQGGVKNA